MYQRKGGMEPKVLEIKYEPQDDVLNVFFSNEKIDDSYDLPHNAIMHIDKNDKPVYLEVFDASKYLNVDLKSLPEKVRQEFLVPA